MATDHSKIERSHSPTSSDAAMNEIDFVENGSLVTKAMHTVTEYIRVNRLSAGDSLPGEKYFADQLQVSRAVMREAYGAMTALRLIDVGNGRRPKVAAIDGSVMAISLSHALNTAQISVAEIWDVRRTIEARTAMLAAVLRTEPEAREILKLAAEISNNTDDLSAVVPLDIAFHQAIARASHNALFVQIVASFEPLMQIATPIAWHTRTTIAHKRGVARHHTAIAKAIAKQDADAAEAAMDAHFDASVRDILLKFRAIDQIPISL